MLHPVELVGGEEGFAQRRFSKVDERAKVLGTAKAACHLSGGFGAGVLVERG